MVPVSRQQLYGLHVARISDEGVSYVIHRSPISLISHTVIRSEAADRSIIVTAAFIFCSFCCGPAVSENGPRPFLRNLTGSPIQGHYGFVKIATITEAKNRLSALLAQVRHGETIVIVDRGRPVARLESLLTEGVEDKDGRLLRLERAGLIRRATTPPLAQLLDEDPPQALDQASIVRALLAEREEAR
jgi:prevent-host-death family protein